MDGWMDIGSDEAGAMGVADGVSEWRTRGLSPQAFAGDLMLACRRVAVRSRHPADWAASSCSSDNRAHRVLVEAFEAVTAHGGSTATVACIDYTGCYLDVASIGDTALLLLRRDAASGAMKVIFRTMTQEHNFNRPFQLVKLPKVEEAASLQAIGKRKLARLTLQVHLAGKDPIDTPADALHYRVPVIEGDLIIIGTDGLFDNMYEDDICRVCTLTLSPTEAADCVPPHPATPAGAVARAVLETATYIAKDVSASVPWSRRAALETGEATTGGKMDDIAVAAAWVVAALPSAPLFAPRPHVGRA
eukprot:GHVU01050408.1.p1 GENE.GHVU01050408.1~~GHVU01050408.1.p1  ORF type:complete len:304 (+),score=67.14 GHVU01050408.1:565-1476(+)